MTEAKQSSLSWGVGLFGISLATAFVYFVIFNPDPAHQWLSQNMRLAWGTLAGTLMCTAIWFYRKSRSSNGALADKIRAGVYSIVAIAIFLALAFRILV